ncbi:MAG TPA: hypothetical protein VLA78_12645 [Paracoccaceae bacterium]|nr:hypothetical protein [Paracoccaceae bacterium]
MALKSKGKSKDDDDEDSLFMPLEEVFRKLKAGPMNFGLYQTTDKDKPVLLAAHKRKNAEFLGKQAKKEAGTTKGTYGRLTLNSGELLFESELDKVPAGLKKRLRTLLKAEGFIKYKPRILMPGGAELGDEDEDEGETIAPGGSATKTRRGTSNLGKAAAETEDPRTRKLREGVQDSAEDLVPRLEELAEGDDEKAADQADKLLKLLRATTDKEDWQKAQSVLDVAEKLLRMTDKQTGA